jgi:hypothetical protein
MLRANLTCCVILLLDIKLEVEFSTIVILSDNVAIKN